MVSQDAFVGIDVSKDRLDVHVRPLGVGFSVSNEAAGYPALIARLRPHTTAIILNANGDPARFARYRLPVVADGVPEFAGPLAGILAGLDWAAAHAPERAWHAPL